MTTIFCFKQLLKHLTSIQDLIHFSYSKPNFQSQILCPRAKKTYFDERIVNIWLQSHRNYTTRCLKSLKYFILIIRILPTWGPAAGPGSQGLLVLSEIGYPGLETGESLDSAWAKLVIWIVTENSWYVYDLYFIQLY